MTLLLLYFIVWLVQKTYAIRCKTKTNHDLIARVFPRFRKFTWFYYEFSLAHWLITDKFLSGVFPFFWLAVVIALHLVLQHSIEKDRKALLMKPMKTECTVHGTARFFGVPLPYTRKFYASLWIQLNVHLHRWRWGRSYCKIIWFLSTELTM